MKRSLVNKLGTAMNTIGAAGVGYYAAKFHLLQDSRAFEILEGDQLLMIGGSCLILLVGLILRIRDLIQRKKEEDGLVQDYQMATNTATTALDEMHKAEDRLEDSQQLFETVLQRVVRDALPDMVEDYLKDRDVQFETFKDPIVDAAEATTHSGNDVHWERE